MYVYRPRRMVFETRPPNSEVQSFISALLWAQPGPASARRGGWRAREPSRRCGEGGASCSHDNSTRDHYGFCIYGQLGRTGAARPLQRRAAPRNRPSSSHGGFVDSRAVRRRKRVSWRPRRARGSRVGRRREVTWPGVTLGNSSSALARATSSRLALSNVRMRGLRSFKR